MRYRLAMLDFDGTLHDSFPWMLRVMNTLAERHGFRRVAPAEIEMLRGRSTREIMAHLRVQPWKVPMIARDAQRLKAAQLAEIPLFPGVDRLLRRLAAAGVVISIVSSDAEANVRGALGPDNARLVSHFACGASLFGKARKFRGVLKSSGIPAAEAIAIGDETRDLEAARRAGVAFGAVVWGYATPDALRALAPDFMFRTLEEIADRLA